MMVSDPWGTDPALNYFIGIDESNITFHTIIILRRNGDCALMATLTWGISSTLPFLCIFYSSAHRSLQMEIFFLFQIFFLLANVGSAVTGVNTATLLVQKALF